MDKCTPDPGLVCVQRNRRPVGSVRLRDLPSLGEEKTASADQVQAVLAGRINSLYGFKAGRWAHSCGGDYRVSTSRPRRVIMGGEEAMKYELAGRADEEVVERLVGYWTYRDGIETVIEASGAAPGRCPAEPLGQIAPGPGDPPEMFSPDNLARFEPLLDRMVAGSKLPPPTQFSSGPASPG